METLLWQAGLQSRGFVASVLYQDWLWFGSARIGVSATMGRLFGIIGVAALLAGATLSVATAAPRRVLFLESYGRNFAPSTNYEANFRAELARQLKEPIDYFEASLATARYANAQDGPFIEYLRTLFAERSLDLVVTFGSPAARFFERHRQQLFPSTPALLTALDERSLNAIQLTNNDAAVAFKIDFPATIENILRILPDTNNVAVVVGDSPNEKFWLGELRRIFEPFKQLQFTWFNTLSFDEMRTRAATLPPHSAILFVLLRTDAAGSTYEEDKALSEMHEVANAPMFSYTDNYFGLGIVGGPLISARDVSQQAATVAARLLRGENPSEIGRIAIGFAPQLFDARELQRWNISEARLPPGSQIQFRPVTLWQQYRWQMLLILVVVFIQAALIAALLIERFRRHRAELESRGRLLQVAHLNRTATAGEMSASIAHELNQPLGAILSNTETAEMLLSADNVDHSQIKEILADIRRDDQRAAEIIRGVRGLIKKRGGIELREFDVNSAIDDAIHVLEPAAKTKGVILSTTQSRRSFSVRADPVHVQQVILNLALNGMDAMPADAKAENRIAIRTTPVGKSEVMVTVADNGPGIPEGKLKDIFEPFYSTKAQGTGLGLSIARTIIETYGGKIWAENGPECGAIFRFTLPLVTGGIT